MSAVELPTIAAQWSAFARISVPPNAPPELRRALRNSFYAGCALILDVSLKIADIEDDEECVRVLASYHNEMQIYAALVAANFYQGDAP